MYDFKPKPKSSFIAPTKDTPVKHRTRAEIMAKLEKRAAYLQQDDLTAVGAVMQAYYQRKLAAAKEQDLPAEEIDNQKENQPSLAQEQEVKSIDVQQSSIPDPVQIKCAECGNEDNIQQQLSGQKPDIAEKSIQQIASIGFSDSPTRLPHIDQIQQSLGVDLSHVQAYIGGSAKLASQNIGAAAFTSGNKIAFKEAPSIELASHEAAHIVQQQSGKVELPGGVGQIGDKYEQNADAVAARVEAGKSAKDLLTDYTHQSRQPEQLQRANLPANQDQEDAHPSSTNLVHNSPEQEQKNHVLAQQQLQIEQVNQHLPKVKHTAEKVSETAQHPGKPIVAEQAIVEPPQPDNTHHKQQQEAEKAGHLATHAFSQANAQTALESSVKALVPPPMTTATNGGSSVSHHPEGDAAVNNLFKQAQSLHQGGQKLLAQAAEARANAQILTGNIHLVKQGINQAEQGITKSIDHLEFRQDVVGKAKNALQVSEQKAAKVAEEAPGFIEKANQGQEKAVPMASKASELAGENGTKTPKDAEAAGKTQEQGQKLNKVATDTSKIAEAFTQTETKAKSLTQEATQAKANNTQSKAKILTMEQTLGQNKERLAQMTTQNTEAKTKVASVEAQPMEMVNQAALLQEKGQALIQAATEMEQRLHQTQTEYHQATGSLFVKQANGRVNVDLVDAVSKEPKSDQEKEQVKQAAETKRQQQIAQIGQMAGKPFAELSAGEKMGIALKLTGQNILSAISNVQWPTWGQLGLLASSLIDPRVPLMGVVSGLSQILSGGANLYSAEQWSKDPLGNALKSTADIATGLTVVFGSITALAGIITALMAAVTIATLGVAGLVTGPIIAFSASVMAAVGGWTFVTGLIAAGLQGLLFIKNLVDAATAKTAEDLQNQSDQMTQDVANAGNALLQAGMGKLAQVGGRQLQSGIAKAGGGVKFATQMGAEGLPARVVAGVKESGGVGTYARGVAGNVGRNVASNVKNLGTAIEEQGLGGLARQTGAKTWTGVKGAVKETWKDLTHKDESPIPGQEFSRRYLVGEDIPQGGLTPNAEATASKALGEKVPVTEEKIPTSDQRADKNWQEYWQNHPNPVIKERFNTAADFYRQAGFKDEDALSHLKGINFNREVTVETIKPNEVLLQYQEPGANRAGRYFTKNSSKSELGIEGESRLTQNRVTEPYVVKKELKALKSTSSDIESWKGSGEKGSGELYYGGGTQYFVPENDINSITPLFKKATNEVPKAETNGTTPLIGKNNKQISADLPPKGLETVNGEQIVAEKPTIDGHKVKITEEGRCLICSTCEDIEIKYAKELDNDSHEITQIKAELEKAREMSNGEEKAQAIESINKKLDRVRNVKNLLTEFDEAYLATLSEDMKLRYQTLIENVKDGKIDLQEAEKRLKVMIDAKERRVFYSKISPVQNLGARNTAFGSIEITYDNKPVTINFGVFSGKGTSSKLISDLEKSGKPFNNETIIPDINNKDAISTVTRQGAHQDSERKIVEHALKKMEELSGTKFQMGENYEGKGFSGEITINSEMTPCNSCENIINQFKDMFGKDIKVNINKGVDYP